jgi:O-antigen/teichoic acid export membrane protein
MKQIGYNLIVALACLTIMLLLTLIHVRIHPLYSPIPIYAIWAGLFSSFFYVNRSMLQGKNRYLRYSVITIIAVALSVATFSACLIASLHFHYAIGGTG